jgi:hypothetical protein
MKRFPSKHGQRVTFDPIRSKTPARGTRAVTRSSAPAPSNNPDSAPPKSRSPSFVELDVVEANLSGDPRYDADD